jgi:hypothetical protein
VRSDRFVQACTAAVMGVAALGVIIGGTALTATATATATAGTVAAARTPAIGAVRSVANLVVYSIDSDGPYFQAIISGAIGDYGPAVTVLPDGNVDPEHTSDMELELRHGTFRLYIGAIAREFEAQTGHEPVFSGTCSDYLHVSATVPIVAGSGTGSYRGASGKFSLSLVGNEDQDTSPCRPGIASQILLLTGSGTVSY